MFKLEDKKTLITHLEEALKNVEDINKNLESYQSLKQANDLYNKLLDEGVIKKRGYTLRGIEDAHLFNARLNNYK